MPKSGEGKSPFADLIAARSTKTAQIKELDEQSGSEQNTDRSDTVVLLRNQNAGALSSSSVRRPVGKSADPDFTRVTVYIRRDTDTRIREKLLAQGRRELSDVFQALADAWVQGNCEV